MITEELKFGCPDLPNDPGFEKTSPENMVYNCAAWAMEEHHRWWEPNVPGHNSPPPGAYWPEGVPHSLTLEAYMAAFATEGYKRCDSGRWDSRYQKIAIYVDWQGEFCHVALQLDRRTWTSKVGILEDVSHTYLSAVEGKLCGKLACYMQRRRPRPKKVPKKPR